MTSTVSFKVDINMPREQAWGIMQDLTKPHLYVPGLLKTDMHTEQTTGVGTSRRVFKKMMALDETVVEWNEGYGFTLRLHDGPKDKPLPASFFKYEISESSETVTTFTATMSYRFWLGSFGKIIDKLFVRPIVYMEIRNVAYAVKHYYEMGTTPTAADIKRLRYQAR